ncbi:MAG TPA: polysaccharide deacetylase family protein [Rectinemataceae bacterium]|nr:polysaccharide deacetylase family protein [Rectinemataceae bacterium]
MPRSISRLAICFSAITLLLLSSCSTVPVDQYSHVSNIRYWKEDSGALGRKAMTVGADELLDREVPDRKDPKIVILMYHNLVFGRTGNEYNRDIYNFEHDLAFLRKRFRIIDFEDLLAIKEGRMRLASDAALVTFDDGDLSMYAIAYPLLKEYGIEATFFIISSFVGEIGYMNWPQIQEMAQFRDASDNKLFTIGSHGASHKYLGDLDESAAMKELTESKAALENNTGEPVCFLALPFGSGAGKEAIMELAQKAGYKAIRTSDNRFVLASSLDLFGLPGIYIDNSSTDKAMGKIWALIGR